MPRYQGEFDGLCGLYAIVNAFEYCEYPNTELIFQAACAALPKKLWPDLLWKGTDFGHMKKMILYCSKELIFTPQISIKYPFEKDTPLSNKDYWRQFDLIFADKAVKCGIIGLTSPSFHWIVASRDTQHRINFYDSTVKRPFVRKYRSSLYAGERKKTSNQWRLDRKELITFSIPGY